MLTFPVVPSEKSMIYFHESDDMLNMQRSRQIEFHMPKWENRHRLHLDVEISGVVTTERSKLFGIESRKCRFGEETTSSHSYPNGVYKQNLCLMECAANAAVKLCGCRPFFYKLGLGPLCNVTGMICLSKKNWTEYRIKCSCWPQCNSVDYSIIPTAKFDIRQSDIFINSKIKKTRIKRDLKFGIHFLIVSFGGAAALFSGCSFISVAELIYYAARHINQKYF
ncbi:sodium channel protein Nach-like [Contarinia nasturtii]|uniref:sodium channel protein Nach-like n=1 Tax=Contarinia nasturtii TaxID=265458 RepID=UPI0012D3EC31|nr:sodium channel protein Nach-like [Contarinia nasturtii]